MHRFEAAYVKCIKSFFGFERRYSVTKMFCDLGLPTFKTVIHNAQVRLDSSVDKHDNFSMLSVLYVVCFYFSFPMSVSISVLVYNFYGPCCLK